MKPYQSVQIFEYVPLDLKKYMGQDRKKTHLPVKPEELKVLPCSAWLCSPYQHLSSKGGTSDDFLIGLSARFEPAGVLHLMLCKT